MATKTGSECERELLAAWEESPWVQLSTMFKAELQFPDLAGKQLVFSRSLGSLRVPQRTNTLFDPAAGSSTREEVSSSAAKFEAMGAGEGVTVLESKGRISKVDTHLSSSNNCEADVGLAQSNNVASGSAQWAPILRVPSNINDLPDECLLEILQRLNWVPEEARKSSGPWDPTSFLECAAGAPCVGRWDPTSLLRCSYVSRKWRDLTAAAVQRLRFGGYNPELWQQKTSGPKYMPVSPVSALQLVTNLSRFSRVTSVELMCCKAIDAPVSADMLIRCDHNAPPVRLASQAMRHSAPPSVTPGLMLPTSPDTLMYALTQACPGLRSVRIWHLNGGKISRAGLAWLCQCQKLERLDLFDALSDDVRTLPDAVFNLPSLKVLRIGRHDGLDYVPERLGQLTGLKELEFEFLHGRGLPRLPVCMGPTASTLERLALWECASVAMLPEWLGTLRALRRLRLCWPLRWDTPIVSLSRLSNLEALTMHCCQSGYLPESMGLLTSLQELHIQGVDGCGLVLLPGSLGKLVNLRRLRLGNCRELTTLPESLGALTSLCELNLYDCVALQEIPLTIGRLHSLELIEISGCASLTSLPETMAELRSLRSLCMHNCTAFKKLPESIGLIFRLQKLRLEFCPALYALPETLGSLSCLSFLSLRGSSSLMFLPASLGHLTNLRKLYLNKCDSLIVLPRSFTNLSSLERLDLSHCRALLTLPLTIKYLPALQILNVMFCRSLIAHPSWQPLANKLRKRGILVLAHGKH